MNRRSVGSFASVIVWVLACSTETGGLGSASNGSDSSSTTDATATAMTSPMTTETSNGSVDGTGSTTMVDGSSSSGEVTTATTTEGETTGTTGGTSTGEPPSVSYPACMNDEECPDPYELCWPTPEIAMPNFCTIECRDERECPAPTSGTAVPVCEGPPDIDICVLDCSEGDCPDGMECVDVFNNGQLLRCTWM